MDLGGTDCPDGLARCSAGLVEVSMVAHLPAKCVPGERSGACACPWRDVGRCATRCAKDGLEVVAAAEDARAQLCLPETPVVRELLPTERTLAPSAPSICADDGLSCVDGIVASCAARGQPVQRIAACLHGCAPGIGIDHGDPSIDDGTLSILCRRAHAERR